MRLARRIGRRYSSAIAKFFRNGTLTVVPACPVTFYIMQILVRGYVPAIVAVCGVSCAAGFRRTMLEVEWRSK